MRIFSLLLPVLFTAAVSVGWETDFDKAKEKARQEHKLILLNFSGSDWCIPCIRLHKEILGHAAFTRYADTALVLVNADFPRLKKNQLSKDRQKQNESLADRYNPKGSFPLTLLLDEEGRVLRTWDGYPELAPEAFTAQLKAVADARK